MNSTQKTRVIDLDPLFGATEARGDALDKEIATALCDDGAFRAAGFPDAAGLECLTNQLLSFFDLPDAVKRPLAIRKHRAESANLYRGFYPLPKGPHWSYNEIFDIGPEPPLPCPELPGATALREANVWPDEERLPGWRRAMLEYAAAGRRLGRAVVAAAARGLGLDPVGLLAPFDGRNNTLRLLHYAEVPPGFVLRSKDGDPIPQHEDGRRILAREHIDTGLLSVLWQDRKGGLQVKGRDDVWRDVTPQPGTLSIHCGDLLARLSGGALQATPHRVLGDGSERFSIGLFLEPEFTAEVLPPDAETRKTYAAHLVDEFPARFDPPQDGQSAATGS